jgi:hypothetical protein
MSRGKGLQQRVLAGNKEIPAECIAFLSVVTHSPPQMERQAKIPLSGVFLHSEKSRGER